MRCGITGDTGRHHAPYRLACRPTLPVVSTDIRRYRPPCAWLCRAMLCSVFRHITPYGVPDVQVPAAASWLIPRVSLTSPRHCTTHGPGIPSASATNPPLTLQTAQPSPTRHRA